MSEERPSSLESGMKLAGVLVTVATFAWGIYTYRDTARLQMELAAAETLRTAETRRIEATRPFLDRQLTLYTEATKATATIAVSVDSDELAKARKRFDELYWGELGLVERDAVANAMVKFREALDANKTRADLAPLALALAHACRGELAASWGTNAWSR